MADTAERSPIVEAREVEPRFQRLQGLQQRIFMFSLPGIGEAAFDPFKTDFQLTDDQIETVTTSSQVPIVELEKAATTERTEYWQGKGDYNAQMNEWRNNFTTNAKKGTRTEFLQKIGGFNGELTLETVDRMYGLYGDSYIQNASGETISVGQENFFRAIIDTFQSPGEITRNIENIEWLAKQFFGDKVTGKMIAQALQYVDECKGTEGKEKAKGELTHQTYNRLKQEEKDLLTEFNRLRGKQRSIAPAIVQRVPETALSPQKESQYDQLKRFESKTEWLLNKDSQIHNVDHHSRVLVLADYLTEELINTGVLPQNIDRDAIRLAAITHDMRRENDGNDNDHPKRAADWILDNGKQLFPQLSNMTIKIASDIVRYQDPNSIPPVVSQDLLQMTHIVEAADGLEYVRFRNNKPDIDKNPGLRTFKDFILQNNLIPRAQQLYDEYRKVENNPEYQGKPFQAVLDTAVRLGFVKKDRNLADEIVIFGDEQAANQAEETNIQILDVQPAAEDPLVITVDESRSVLSESKAQRLRELPNKILEDGHTLCANLRKRIRDQGEREQFTRNGVPMVRMIDPVTRIDIPLQDPRNVDNAWFNGAGFVMYADQVNLPLIYLIPGGNHAQLLLKMEERNGQRGYVYYDPLGEGRESWAPLKNQLSFNEYINQEQLAGRLRVDTIEVDGVLDSLYKIPTNQPGWGDMELRRGGMYDRYLHHVLPTPVFGNGKGLRDLSNDHYDLTLSHDRDLPAEVNLRLQFDAKNCLPLSFYSAAYRYALKPGDSQFKSEGIQQMERDFGIRILKREEVV